MPVGEFDYAKLLIPVYESLYERAQKLLERFNPCQVREGICERHRRGCGANFCCSGCTFLGKDGCQVKALQCSLWVCQYDLLHESQRRAFNSLMWAIFYDAYQFHLLVPRGSMEDSIAEACKYYVEHRDERIALEDLAANYQSKPVDFFPPVKAEKPVYTKRALIPEYDYAAKATKWCTDITIKKEEPVAESVITETKSISLDSAVMKDKFFSW